jgi:mRNA-degrading endonuclease RelE of RelBE toxin-antitoxin system
LDNNEEESEIKNIEDENEDPMFDIAKNEPSYSQVHLKNWRVKVETEAETSLKELPEKVAISFRKIFCPAIENKGPYQVKRTWIKEANSKEKTCFLARIIPELPYEAMCSVDKDKKTVSISFIVKIEEKLANTSFKEFENIITSKVKTTSKTKKAWEIVNKDLDKIIKDLPKEAQEECKTKLFPELKKGSRLCSYEWDPLTGKKNIKTFHCHLITKPPTYVAIWQADEKSQRIFIVAIGTHESVLKAKK